MNAVVREWIEKAEGDFATASREYRVRKNPNFDAVCFHAQKCIEKYLKAALQIDDVPVKKTHDLNVLLNACSASYPLWAAYRDELKTLTQYATVFR